MRRPRLLCSSVWNPPWRLLCGVLQTQPLFLKPRCCNSRATRSPHKLRGTERWYLCGYISSKLAFSSSSECGRPHRCLFLALLARAHHFSRRALVANDGQGRWRLLFRLRQLKGHTTRTEPVIISISPMDFAKWKFARRRRVSEVKRSSYFNCAERVIFNLTGARKNSLMKKHLLKLWGIPLALIRY